MPLLNDIFGEFRTLGPSKDDDKTKRQQAWRRRAFAALALFCLGLAWICRRWDDPNFSGWKIVREGIVFLLLSAAAALLVESLFVRRWEVWRQQDIISKLVEAQSLALADLDEPGIGARLVMVRVGLFARWCSQTEQHARRMFAIGLLLLAVAALLSAKAVGFFASRVDTAAWAASSLAALCIIASIVLAMRAATTQQRIGLAIRRLDLSRLALTSLKAPEIPANGFIRIDAGGPGFTDTPGRTWQVSSGFRSGTAASVPVATVIAGTAIPQLYRTSQQGMDSFEQVLPDGAYVINLHFAETDAAVATAGQHTFTYSIGNQPPVIIDIFTEVGVNRVLVKPHRALVTTGRLTISFARTNPAHGDPILNGIEIIPST